MTGRLDDLWVHIVRFAGLGIAIYETVFERTDRPSLLLLAAGMIGLKNARDLQRVVNSAKKKMES